MRNQKSKIKNHLHHAAWIIVDAETIIQNGYLLTEDGQIKGVYTSKPKDAPQTYTDHGPGVIMPPLVNAHLHLELSALKNKVAMDQGFQVWVADLLEKRQALGEDALKQGAKQAIVELQALGNLYIGEISTLGLAKDILEHSELCGMFFQEYLGTAAPETLDIQHSSALSKTVAGHAPHTTAPEVLKRLKQQSLAQKLPFSIHLAESEAEIEFIHKKKGDWAVFLTSRGINYKTWEIGSVSPVAYLKKLGVLDRLTLAVHLLHITENDLKIIKDSGTKVCVCPKSNLNIHKKLPDIEKMIKKGLKPALGTDSLASNNSLDIRDEMAFVAENYPNLKPEKIFSMATLYGAKALGLENITGTLNTGKKADFIYLPIQAEDEKQLLEKIVFNR
ncbi:MAG: amidohydrolase family protein [Desulfobacula sp.]|jgi:aminodeoxyfutalosine deaminase|nr:amidohydrolase family protein [Desulfobacula sp.]